MARPRARTTSLRRHDARFLWQIVLVVVPVVILSVTALYSLKRDRASIDQDARRNAAVLVADFARQWGERVGNELAALEASACSSGKVEAQSPTPDAGESGVLCGLVVDGRIRVPLDYPSAPTPPDWLRELTSAQTRAWQLLEAAPADADIVALRRAAAALSDAPRAARFNAEWVVLRAEVHRGAAPKGIDQLIDLANRASGATTESGTPISDLALLLAVRTMSVGAMPDAVIQILRRRIVEQPSLLTKSILEEATRVAAGSRAMAQLNSRWAANQRAIGLLRQLSTTATQPTATWLGTDVGAWVALVHPLTSPDEGGGDLQRTAYQVTLVSARRLEIAFQTAVSDRGDLPTYAAARIQLGDRSWRVGSTKPAPANPIELAAATGLLELPLAVPADAVSAVAGELLRVAPQSIPSRPLAAGGSVRLLGMPGGQVFSVTLELDDAGALYASYTVRLWMAIGLIGMATLAAFGGLVGAWRAFERQRRLSEMKSNFVASVSHELRAPITSVGLMVESLERGTVESADRRQEYLRVISQECRRLSSLVENLLEFSQIDRGKREYRLEPTDLVSLIAHAAELMRPYAVPRNVRLVCDLAAAPTNLPHLSVDSAAIQQALVNLVDNAIKHSPEAGEVTLGIEVVTEGASASVPGPRWIRLFVTDHGPGIPVEQQERIFEPFYRTGSELRRETQGVGLGLSIVKHIAEAHSGRVTVRSGLGTGSSFAIELPLRVEPA